MSKKGKGIFLCVILSTLPALLVHSTLVTGKNQTESVDPKVDRIIHDVSQYISGLESFSMEMVMSVKIEAKGMKQDMTSSFSLALQRPDKIAMIMKEGMMGLDSLFKYITQDNLYDEFKSKVQAVHVGAVPDLKEILKKDLDKLLAGKKLP